MGLTLFFDRTQAYAHSFQPETGSRTYFMHTARLGTDLAEAYQNAGCTAVGTYEVSSIQELDSLEISNRDMPPAGQGPMREIR